MENIMMVKVYSIYLVISLGMTFFVAKVLFQNSKIFMLDIFKGREEIAFPTNRLFEIGFYLMNVGAALLFMKTTQILSHQGLLETLSLKIGSFSIYLGLMLFMNLYLLFRGKKVSSMKRSEVEDLEIDLDGAAL